MTRFKELRLNCNIVDNVETKNKTKLTIDELSAMTGIERSKISRYENGVSSYDIETLQAYSDFFGVTVDYLLGISDIVSKDEDINMICDITGLSEDAVNNLKLCQDDELIQTAIGGRDPAAVINAILCASGYDPGRQQAKAGIIDNDIIQYLYDYLFFDDNEIKEAYILKYIEGDSGGVQYEKTPLKWDMILEDSGGNEIKLSHELLEQIMLSRIRDALKQLRNNIRARAKDNK